MDMDRIVERLVAAEKVINQKDLVKFFVDNPNPNDDKVHTFAEKLGVEPDVLESEIYKLATIAAEFLNNGRSNEKDITEDDVDAKELKMGIEVEKEHTPNKEIAKRISLDHLAEFGDYYTRLKKMEAEGEKAKDKK